MNTKTVLSSVKVMVKENNLDVLILQTINGKLNMLYSVEEEIKTVEIGSLDGDLSMGMNKKTLRDILSTIDSSFTITVINKNELVLSSNGSKFTLHSPVEWNNKDTHKIENKKIVSQLTQLRDLACKNGFDCEEPIVEKTIEPIVEKPIEKPIEKKIEKIIEQKIEPIVEKKIEKPIVKKIEPINIDNAISTDIKELANLQGIVTEIIGKWLWVTGNTYTYKDTIKSLGFQWSSAKKAWYKPYVKSFSKKHYSLDEIRARHGSLVIDSVA